MSIIYIFRKRISSILWMHGLNFPQVLFLKIGSVSCFTLQRFKYLNYPIFCHKYFKTFSLLLTYFLVISTVQWIFFIFGAKLECFSNSKKHIWFQLLITFSWHNLQVWWSSTTTECLKKMWICLTCDFSV